MSEMLAFSVEQVCRLTGLSISQIRYWDRQGFFTPQYVDDSRRRPFSRVYSFRDVVGLRTLALLRNKHHVSLQELRKVGAWLREHYESPWASLTFYVGGGKIFFDDPHDRVRRVGALPEQTAMHIEMERIAGETREALSQLRERRAEDVGQITRNRYVLHNAYVVAGTRIPTSAIWNFYRAGYSIDDIIQQYPRLTPDDVRAALAHETVLAIASENKAERQKPRQRRRAG
ncbi:MAG: DUF433 domain-containing protein [Chloroflexi bacterium]|nr:DUF433 domain-containing protein [Chloroflexota bacterium]